MFRRRNCEDDGKGGEVCYNNTDLANGPSDGGEIRLDVAPDRTILPPTSTPEPGQLHRPYAGTGACVDGICFNAGTGERQVYDGGQDGRVYLDDATADDYKDTDDYCSYDNEGNCVRDVHDQQQDFYSRPGVNVYADPDPQDSSLGPFDGSTNTHVGTGGVKIFGVSVVDAQNPTAVGSSVGAASGMQSGLQRLFLALARTPGMVKRPAMEVAEAPVFDVLHQGAPSSSRPAAMSVPVGVGKITDKASTEISGRPALAIDDVTETATVAPAVPKGIVGAGPFDLPEAGVLEAFKTGL